MKSTGKYSKTIFHFFEFIVVHLSDRQYNTNVHRISSTLTWFSFKNFPDLKLAAPFLDVNLIENLLGYVVSQIFAIYRQIQLLRN